MGRKRLFKESLGESQEEQEEQVILEESKTSDNKMFIALEEYGIIRGVKRGRMVVLRFKIKNLKPRELQDWDNLYRKIYNEEVK